MPTIYEKITKCKVTLLVSQPWFGQLACYLNLVETDKIPTMAVNERGDLFYNPKFIEGMTSQETKSVICHEILHLAYRHCFRVKQRNAQIWNIAADLKVNEEISHMGNNFKLPEGALMPDHSGVFKLDKGVTIKDIGKKNTETIYAELMRNLPAIPKSVTDALMRDILDDGLGEIGPAEAKKLEREWVTRVNQATQACKKAGKVPGGIIRELDELENPEVVWHRVIRERFSRAIKERSWQRPARKYLPQYFPGGVRVKGLNAAIAIDTSGSMSKHDMVKAISEIYSLADTFKAIKMWVLDCDTQVYNIREVNGRNKSAIMALKPKGGGGTSFKPIWDAIKTELKDHVDCLVFFTDGYGDGWPKKPKYPVYWVTRSRDVKFPYGKVIYLKDE